MGHPALGYLLDEIRLHGESAELRDEVTGLARKYGIVTPYTAYLIVEDETRRKVPLAMQSLQQFRDDRAAREVAAANWDGFKNETSGNGALGGANHSLALKLADAPAVAAAGSLAGAIGRSGFPATVTAAPTAPAEASKSRLVQILAADAIRGGQELFPEQQPVDGCRRAKKSKRQAAADSIQLGGVFCAGGQRAEGAAVAGVGQNVQSSSTTLFMTFTS